MSRSWNYVGFNKAAKAILNESAKIGTKIVVDLDLQGYPVGTYTQDRFSPSYTKEEYGREEVFCGQENVFHRYTFSDGRVLEDYTQEEPWSSGPCTFMALRDAETKEPLKETLWSEDEIAQYV